ncbi:metallophosphoesterase family protein [Frigoribacterium sp. 2-23]|uniref:metallophosphoesterase family protein n=1 Tax=Frigoribacterium sp. 2-23 TaxID=3415006 RepID=UPI003C702258
MPTRVVVVSDTHVPQKAKAVPAVLWMAVESSDLVVHAGDWTGLEIVTEFEERAPRLLGVFGNNDGADVRARMPEVARATVEGVRLAVVHETGSKEGREGRLDARFPDTDLLIFGHSHIPWDTTTPAGLRLLNPGSPTDRRRQPTPTYLTLTLDQGRVEDVVLHELPVRRGDLGILPHPRMTT